MNWKDFFMSACLFNRKSRLAGNALRRGSMWLQKCDWSLSTRHTSCQGPAAWYNEPADWVDKVSVAGFLRS